MKKLKKIGLSLLTMIVVALVVKGVLIKKPKYIEVTARESVFEDKYYYEQLSERKQNIYKELYQGLSEQKEEFSIHCESGTEANDIFYVVLYDFPEMFWCDGEVVSTAYANTYVTVRPKYNCSKGEKEKKEAEIQQVTETFLEEISDLDSEYEKIKYTYEYLVNHVDYKEDAADNQNIYSALVRGESVCAGYAKATQYLLEQMGVSCIYVTGEATSREVTVPHAWNIVKCDGGYYYVDTTWADPLFDSDRDPELNTHMVYDYLCCTDSMLAQTHALDRKYMYPICAIDNLNYYRMNDMYYDSIDKRELRQVLRQSIDKKEDSVLFKFASKELYREGRKVLIDELLEDAANYLGQQYGISRVNCRYTEDEQLYKVIIYWQYK